MKYLFAIILILISTSAYADEAQTAEKVEAYLNALTTFSADFSQIDPEGKEAGGKFYLKRPGKFLWQYDERQPVEIVSDGSQLVYYDKKLKEVTYTNAKNSLAGFLSRKVIKFSGDIKLLSATDENNEIHIVVTQKNKPEDGVLSLIFDDKTMQFIALNVTDQNGGMTKIKFSNQQLGSALADNIFIFKNPKYSSVSNVWEGK